MQPPQNPSQTSAKATPFSSPQPTEKTLLMKSQAQVPPSSMKPHKALVGTHCQQSSSRGRHTHAQARLKTAQSTPSMLSVTDTYRKAAHSNQTDSSGAKCLLKVAFADKETATPTTDTVLAFGGDDGDKKALVSEVLKLAPFPIDRHGTAHSQQPILSRTRRSCSQTMQKMLKPTQIKSVV